MQRIDKQENDKLVSLYEEVMSSVEKPSPSLKNFLPPQPLSLISQLKEVWGQVDASNVPWEGIKSKQVKPNTGMSYNPKNGGCFVVVYDRDKWSTVEWSGIKPEVLESSIKIGEPSFEDLFKIEGMQWSGGHQDHKDVSSASRAFVQWCKEG